MSNGCRDLRTWPDCYNNSENVYVYAMVENKKNKKDRHLIYKICKIDVSIIEKKKKEEFNEFCFGKHFFILTYILMSNKLWQLLNKPR